MKQVVLYPRPPRKRKSKSQRRYRVDYNALVFDDGAVSWVSYYRTERFARIAAWYHYNMSYSIESIIFTDQKEEG